jgi:hypothetical protein
MEAEFGRLALTAAATVLTAILAGQLKDVILGWVRKLVGSGLNVRGPTGESVHVRVNATPDDIKLEILKTMLNDSRFQMRSFDSLKRAIDSDDDKTRELLERLHAQKTAGRNGEIFFRSGAGSQSPGQH